MPTLTHQQLLGAKEEQPGGQGIAETFFTNFFLKCSGVIVRERFTEETYEIKKLMTIPKLEVLYLLEGFSNSSEELVGLVSVQIKFLYCI